MHKWDNADNSIFSTDSTTAYCSCMVY